MLVLVAIATTSNDEQNEEESWYIESTRRLDPRVSYDDVVMRMMNVNTRAECGEMQFRNLYLNNPLSRSFWPRFNIISWHSNETAARARVLVRLTQAQVAANTTRGLTPGLVDPSKPNGARVDLPRPCQNQGRRSGRRTKRIDRPSEAEVIDLTADADGLEEPPLQSQPAIVPASNRPGR